jgi:hypothetical protein
VRNQECECLSVELQLAVIFSGAFGPLLLLSFALPVAAMRVTGRSVPASQLALSAQAAGRSRRGIFR